MRIFKFGGASVKDAKGIKNLEQVIRYTGYNQTLIVISAMGKITNALELIIKDYLNKKQIKNSLKELGDYHYGIINELFENVNDSVYKSIKILLSELEDFLASNKATDYNFVYDQVICFGELLSTTIVSHYLKSQNIENTFIDVRELIKTDDNYRGAKVDWEETKTMISRKIASEVLYVTQGFLGRDKNNFTTTLGREGSDYTAAILGYGLNAESIVIWKDVPGVLNADPRYFKDTKLLSQISYEEAIELSFYGASVIHPKTIQPLKKKDIPLYVKSFLDPKSNGTCVSSLKNLSPKTPCFIVKKAQTALYISTRDFSFFLEDHIREVLSLLHKYKVRVDLIQKSAISFSLCVEDKFNMLKNVLENLNQKFNVKCFENVSLFTIRHAREEDIKTVESNKEVLLKQQQQDTVQIVVK